MASKGFSLDFGGFLDFAEQIEQLGGSAALKKATENAIKKSAQAANINVGKALADSQYSFKQGVKGSKGRAKKSLAKIGSAPVEWEGNVIKAPVGVDLEDAYEVMILIMGTPHIKPDTKLKQAIKVKGRYKRDVERIQQNEFLRVLQEVL